MSTEWLGERFETNATSRQEKLDGFTPEELLEQRRQIERERRELQDERERLLQLERELQDTRGTLTTTDERVKLEILDLGTGSTHTQQRAQWRRLCLLLHEDKVNNLHKDSERDKQTCQQAYTRLDKYANVMRPQPWDPTWRSSTASSRQQTRFDPEPEASEESKKESRPWTNPTPRYASSKASPYDTPWHASSSTSTHATPGYASSSASTHATDSAEDGCNPNQHPKGTAECYVYIKNDGSNMWFCRLCKGKGGRHGRFCTRDHLAKDTHKYRVAQVLSGKSNYIDDSNAPTYDWTTPYRW
jgi:hypothetical protein